MKLRWVPIFLTIIGTAVLLFGGLFVYRSVAMENPLAHLTDGLAGVTQEKPQIGGDRVDVELKLADGVGLRDLFATLQDRAEGIIGKRDLQLKVTSDSAPELDSWWSSRLFDVAEAMETKHYAQIPATLESHAGELPGLAVATEIDDNNVYVRLSKDGHAKYVVLPRVAAQMGVWPNE